MIPLQRFKDCLSNRPQYVQLNDCKTDKMTINRGVPRGSVSGPLIFLLYVNDIQNASTKLDFALFADDTNVFFLFFFKDKNLSNLINVRNLKKAFFCR